MAKDLITAPQSVRSWDPAILYTMIKMSKSAFEELIFVECCNTQYQMLQALAIRGNNTRINIVNCGRSTVYNLGGGGAHGLASLHGLCMEK